MCFIISPSQPNELVAEEDIEVFKIMLRNKKGVKSYLFGKTPYKFGKKYHAEDGEKFLFKRVRKLVVIDEYDGIKNFIQYGFHSYTTDFLKGEIKLLNTYCMVKCIIPKDTRYYINNDSMEIVSLSIIFKEIYEKI